MDEDDKTSYVGEFITKHGPVSVYVQSDDISPKAREDSLAQARRELIECITKAYEINIVN